MTFLHRQTSLAVVLAAAAWLGGMESPAKEEAAQPPQVSAPEPDRWRAAVEQPGRPEEDRRRDADRRPAEVLEFLGIQPGMRVGELFAGDGYYTEILAHLLGPGGSLSVHTGGVSEADRARLDARLARLQAPQVTLAPGAAPVDPGFGDGLDAVLLFRGYHDYCYMQVDIMAFNRAVYEMLKPGGVFGVIDHRGAPGTGCDFSYTLHRIDPWLVEYEAMQAGLVLEETSDLLAHPGDDRARSVHRDGGVHRDRSDRFLFRFRKPVHEPSEEEWEKMEPEPRGQGAPQPPRPEEPRPDRP